ncbi:hypothetical protein BDV11DRAFT_117257 [Aspergillus similis]
MSWQWKDPGVPECSWGEPLCSVFMRGIPPSTGVRSLGPTEAKLASTMGPWRNKRTPKNCTNAEATTDLSVDFSHASWTLVPCQGQSPKRLCPRVEARLSLIHPNAAKRWASSLSTALQSGPGQEAVLQTDGAFQIRRWGAGAPPVIARS